VLADDVYLAALADAAGALARPRPLDLGARVPACPEWDVADLLGHLGGVHRWATALVTAPPDVRVRRRDLEPPPEGEAVLAWCAAGVAGSLAALRDADLDGEAMTWTGLQPRRWWLRRLAHETIVHLVDLAQAIGDDLSVPGDLAVDLVDEWLEVFVPARVTTDDLAGLEGTVHLHRTGTPESGIPGSGTPGSGGPTGEWLLTFADGALTVERAHMKGDVAARGPAATIALVLWHRAPLDELEVFGDRARLERLLDLTRI
jgi:uncharacterized protein (TIGR03083 family)